MTETAYSNLQTMPDKKEFTLIKNVESFQIGSNAQIRFTTRDKIPQFDKSKTYYLIIAEAGPDPVPEFNR